VVGTFGNKGTGEPLGFQLEFHRQGNFIPGNTPEVVFMLVHLQPVWR